MFHHWMYTLYMFVESSSYEELLIRLIDDFEDESFHHLKHNPLEGSGSMSTGSKKVKSSEKSPNKHHATRRHSTQHGPGTQAQTTHSSQVTSGAKDNLEGASTPDLYSRHARRKSQDVSSHFAATLPAGPGQGVVKSKRSEKKSKKPIIRNLMVKDRTGKPSTQAGHLKETVLKTTSSDSTDTITGSCESVLIHHYNRVFAKNHRTAAHTRCYMTNVQRFVPKYWTQFHYSQNMNILYVSSRKV